MKQVAFLRGINVGGVKLKSAELKEMFEKQGFTEVETVLSTGNIIFDGEAQPDLSFLPVAAFVRTDKAVSQLLSQNPFQKSPDQHIYVLISDPSFAEIAQAQAISSYEAVELENNTIYWQVPIGSTLETDFGKILGKKKFKEQFTSRNINTLEKIVAKF